MEFSSQILLSEPTYRLVFQQQISSKQAAGTQTCTCFCLGPSSHAADFQQLPGAKRIPVCTEARRHPEKGECKGSPGTPCVQYELKGRVSQQLCILTWVTTRETVHLEMSNTAALFTRVLTHLYKGWKRNTGIIGDFGEKLQKHKILKCQAARDS